MFTHKMNRASKPTNLALTQFIALSAVFGFMVFAFSVLALSVGVAALSCVVFLSIMSFAAAKFAQSYPHERLGSCNAITLFRAAMVTVLAGFVFRPDLVGANGEALFVVAAILLALDGVDGWLARKHGLSSPFGARFDMETDAAFGAVIATLLLLSGRFGPEILILGYTRYAFIGASCIWPWLACALPESLLRKTICVVQNGALCVLLLPFIAPVIGGIITWFAVGLLLWSFLRDIKRLYQRRMIGG